MAQLHAYSLPQIENAALPGPSAVVCMADSPSLLAKIMDAANVRARLDLTFDDSGHDFGLVRAPGIEDARRILEFVRAHEATVPHIVFQCQVGIGRSLAAYAALTQIQGGDAGTVLRQGTHNRVLYRKLVEAAGRTPRAEPLVSLVVRVKYAPDRMAGFIHSIRRQRYDNWELVFVSDGPNPGARDVVQAAGDSRVRLLETAKALGRWGHPHRQVGIDAAKGELIGLSNDDNYYVPGYIEQMVNALEETGAEIAFCAMLHSYWGWRAIAPGNDLGSWIARRDLLRRTPWSGDSFFYDAEYLKQLKANAGARIATVDRALFIHN